MNGCREVFERGREDPDPPREAIRTRWRRSASETTHILDDLKVNSARLVDVVLAFEDEFDIEIADEGRRQGEHRR